MEHCSATVAGPLVVSNDQAAPSGAARTGFEGGMAGDAPLLPGLQDWPVLALRGLARHGTLATHQDREVSRTQGGEHGHG